MNRLQYGGKEIRRWEIGPSSFLAAPESGARLMNWNITLGDGSVRDIIHWPENAEAEDLWKVRGGNPILFPFAGTSYADGARDRWRSRDGNNLPMPQHGFARQGAFEIVSIDEYGFSAEFKPDDISLACYPYDYDLLVVYKFADLLMQVTLLFTNKDTQAIPWSPGHHFYFQLPWHHSLSRSDFKINVPAKTLYSYGPDGSLGKLPTSSGEISFSDPSLVNCIHTNLTGPEAIFGTANGEENISVRVEGGGKPGDTRCFVTWTENEESPFYCVEPWMGPPNSTSHEQGPRFVGPGQRDEFSVEVKLL